MESTNDLFTEKSFNTPRSSLNSKEYPSLLYFVVINSGIGAFLFGYIASVAGGALVNMRTDYDFSPYFVHLWVCMFLGITGSVLHGGFLADKIGRKKGLMISSFLFLLGAVVLAAAFNMQMVTIGLLLNSMAMGLVLTISPIYIIECAPKEIRGRLGTIHEMMLQLGISTAIIVSQTHKMHAWRIMFGVAAIPSIVQLIFLHKFPDSPRYLVMKGQVLEASEVLATLRVPGQSNLSEINDIKAVVALDSEKTGLKVWTFAFTTYYVRKTMIVGCLIQMFEQLSGITIVYLSYVRVLNNYGLSQGDVMLLSSIPLAFKLVSAVIGFKLIETIGRKKLLTYGFFGCAFSNAVLGIGFFMGSISTPSTSAAFDVGSRGYCSKLRHCFECTEEPNCGYCVPKAHPLREGSCVEIYIDQEGSAFAKSGRCAKHTTSLDPMLLMLSSCPQINFKLYFIGATFFFLFFEAAIGPVTTVVVSEMFPLWTRAFGFSIARLSGLFALASSAAAFREFGSITGWFFGYTAINLIASVYLGIRLPETMSKPLEWLQCEFMTEKDRRKFKALLSKMSLSMRWSGDEEKEPKLPEPIQEPPPSILPEMLELSAPQSAEELEVNDLKQVGVSSGQLTDQV